MGIFISVPVTPIDDLVSTAMLANEATAVLYMRQEHSPRNYYEPGAMERWGRDAHQELEELCDAILANTAVLYSHVSQSPLSLDSKGHNLICTQALKNAGYSDRRIAEIVGDPVINARDNLKIIWAYDTDGSRYDFTHIPIALIEMTEAILSDISACQDREPDSDTSLLHEEVMREVAAADWTSLTVAEFDRIYEYLLTKINRGEFVFAKIPVRDDSLGGNTDRVIIGAALLPHLDQAL